jgi:hypothetical protein
MSWMAGGADIENGHRLGGQADRAGVAERLAARAAPLVITAPAPAAHTTGPVPGNPLSVAGISNCAAEDLSCAHDMAPASMSDRAMRRERLVKLEFMWRDSGKSPARRKICEETGSR